MIAPKRPQLERVLDQLHYDRLEGHGTCGSTLLSMFIPRYSGRIFEARHERGCVIEERPCRRHAHEGPVADYLLVHDPATDTPKQLALSLVS